VFFRSSPECFKAVHLEDVPVPPPGVSIVLILVRLLGLLPAAVFGRFGVVSSVHRCLPVLVPLGARVVSSERRDRERYQDEQDDFRSQGRTARPVIPE
jgi:hypothetical protein